MIGLEQIQWDSLQHSEGNARNLPMLLIKISDGDLAAFDRLGDLIFRDGLCSATAPSIPFLIKIATQNRPKIALWIAKCCRSIYWTKANSLNKKWAEDVIESVNTSVELLIESARKGEESAVWGAASILFYGRDRERIAESLSAILKERTDLGTFSRTVLALSCHGAPGIHVADAKTKTLEAFAARISQSTTGMFGSERDALIADLRDFKKVQELQSLLHQLDDALGSLGELLSSSESKIRRDIIAPLILILSRSKDALSAWKMCISLLHIVFNSSHPAQVSDLEPNQRLLLEAIEEHPSLWELDHIASDISELIGFKIESREKLRDYLGQSIPVVALIMTPNDSPLVKAIASEQWMNTPWLVFKGDTSKLEWQIDEDRSYFTDEIMAKGYQIASAIISNIAYEIDPFIDSFRFYPNLSVDELTTICQSNGWKVHHVPEWARSLAAVSDSEALIKAKHLDKGLLWKNLPKETKKNVEICVAYLSGSLWDEAKEWHRQVIRSRVPIAPIMFAKYRDRLEITVSYWPYDRLKAKRNGIQSGDPYLLVAIEDPETLELQQIRIYFGHLLQMALKIIRKHQDMLAESGDSLQKFLQEMLLKIEKVSLEFENGVIQDLSLQKYDA